MNRGMKRKTIQKNIETKIYDWLKSIDDESLRERARYSLVVTGGCIASMLQGEMPNDYDVYFDNIDVCADIARYYLGKLPESKNAKVSRNEVVVENGQVSIFIKSAGVASEESDQQEYNYFEFMPEGSSESYLNKITSTENVKKATYKVAYMTTNAITLTDGIQIIIRFVGDPVEIHKNFDYVHCTNWYTKKDGVVLNRHALESIMTKELRYIGSKFPICSLFRMKKFLQREWTITAGTIFKIAYDVSKLDLNKTEVLREQLTGVDQAYFREVISVIERETKDKDIDRTYLFELISRVFDENEI